MDRFWDKVKKAGPDDCWEWQLGVGSHGYGKFTQGRQWEMTAHRFAYTITHGEIPKGQVVRHKCDNRRCCNPAHLELGKQGDNIRDMHVRRKGVWRKLTFADAREIYRRANEGPRGIGLVLAEEFGVSPSQISLIKRGKQWREDYYLGHHSDLPACS